MIPLSKPSLPFDIFARESSSNCPGFEAIELLVALSFDSIFCSVVSYDQFSFSVSIGLGLTVISIFRNYVFTNAKQLQQ